MKPEIKERIEQIRRGILPKGYKKANNKIVPQEWQSVSLGELGEARNGLNFSRAENGYRIRMLGVGDFQKHTILRDVTFLTEVSLNTFPEEDALLQDGDIVFVRSNGSKELVGRNLLVYPGENLAAFSGFCIRYRMRLTETTTPEYINYWLDTGALKEKLQRENQGSDITNLNQGTLCSLTVCLPGLEEQRRIAEILTTQDKIIALKERRLAEKRRQKTFLAQRLLTGKTRLPGFDGEWKRMKLSEVLTERKELKNKQNLRICSVAIQKGVVDQIEHLGRSYAAANTSKYNVVHYGDVIYTKSPTGEFPYGIIKQSQMREKVAVSPLYAVYEPVTYELGYLLHTYFGFAINCRNYLLPIIQKGAKNTINITNTVFISNRLLLPCDKDEQIALGQLFAIADREIEALQRDLELEKRKKKALMQLLLTGVVRVNSRRRSA